MLECSSSLVTIKLKIPGGASWLDFFGGAPPCKPGPTYFQPVLLLGSVSNATSSGSMVEGWVVLEDWVGHDLLESGTVLPLLSDLAIGVDRVWVDGVWVDGVWVNGVWVDELGIVRDSIFFLFVEYAAKRSVGLGLEGVTYSVFLDFVVPLLTFLDFPDFLEAWGLGEGCWTFFLVGGCALLVPKTGPLGDRRMGTMSLASSLSYLNMDFFLVSVTS